MSSENLDLVLLVEDSFSAVLIGLLYIRRTRSIFIVGTFMYTAPRASEVRRIESDLLRRRQVRKRPGSGRQPLLFHCRIFVIFELIINEFFNL